MNAIKISLLFLVILGCNDSGSEGQKFEEIATSLTNNELPKAKEVFSTINPDSKNGYKFFIAKMNILFNENEFRKALTIADQFNVSYPFRAYPSYFQGLLYFNLGSYDSAKVCLEKSMRVFADQNKFVYVSPSESFYEDTYIYKDLVFMLGLNDFFRGSYKSAISTLESCIALNYKLKESYYVIAESYVGINNHTLALQYAALAKKEGNNDADSLIYKIKNLNP